jgi:hypothetical protein
MKKTVRGMSGKYGSIMSNHQRVVHNTKMSSATVFLGYLRDTWRYIMFPLISAVDFYYVINKLIILIPNPH